MFRPGHYISFPSVVQFPRIPREKTLGKTRTAYVNGYFLWVHLLTCMHACVCVCVFYCILSEMISRIECKYIPKIIHGSIQFTCVLACSVTSYVSSSLQSHVPWSASLLCPENLPVKNTGAGCHALLQGIFSTQGSNAHLLCLLPCRWILYGWATTEALFKVL